MNIRRIALRVWATFTLALLGIGSAHAQIWLQCDDYSSAGRLECTYQPQYVSPWRYQIPGPKKATAWYLNDSDVLAAYDAIRKENCSACDCGTLISRGGMRDEGSSWGPDHPTVRRESLTYRVIGRGADGKCLPPSTFTTIIFGSREVNCGRGWSTGNTEDFNGLCFRNARPRKECLASPKPISMPTASKVFREQDYMSPASPLLGFVRHYSSAGFSHPRTADYNLWENALGSTWTHNYAGKLTVGPSSIWVAWGAARPSFFTVPTAASGLPRELAPVRKGEAVRLVQITSTRYAFYTEANEVIVFEGSVPVSVHEATGRGVTIANGPSGPVSVEGFGGRRLVFSYSGFRRLQSVLDPAGEKLQYEYVAPVLNPGATAYEGNEFRMLNRAVFQDLTDRRYGYPRWTMNGTLDNNYTATKITSIINELGDPFQTIEYTSPGGLVSRTQLAGGVGTYVVSASGQVTDPLGAVRNYSSSTSTFNEISRTSQPAGAGCAAASASTTFDANGNVASRNDFRGNRTCFVNDAVRNIETFRIEGLIAGGPTCSTHVAAGAVLPAGARKVTTQWHPDWRLESKVSEPGRITTMVYNGQPDPFAGGARASCAPTTAVLPDGKPIAVLCRRVEQATTDSNGAAGFAAALQTGVPVREEKWTYNQHGQVLTHDGPRTDVADITRYAYYADTTFTGTGFTAVGHTVGDLQRVTNATGKPTEFTKYDKHGQLLESIDANGVVTSFTYDRRQRLLSTTVGGQKTSYTYDLAGQLKRVTLPDTTWVGFDYDAAQRRTAAYDSLGNRIDYELDNAGNVTGEKAKDAAGILRRQLNRSIDALGRVQQTTGRAP